MASAISEAQKLLPQFKSAVQSKDVTKANSLLIQLKVRILMDERYYPLGVSKREFVWYNFRSIL